MYRFAASILLLLVACTVSTRLITYTSNTIPVYKIDPPPQKIILLSTYDIAAKKYRDNKEELFQSLIDTTMQWAAMKIKNNYGIETEVIPGYTPQAVKADSVVHASMITHKATHAIVLASFDAYFNQTRVDVSQDGNGKKSREAYYDIVNDISFMFYEGGSLIKEKDIHRSRYHSSRSVVSGLLAAGPNIVAKRNDAYKIAQESWDEYLNNFFPGEKQHSRQVFIGKGFETIGQAIVRNDYEAALIESMRLVDDPDTKKAAMANYNCAVFMERKSQPEEAKKYLIKSLSLAMLTEAKLMMNEYQ